MQEKQREVKKAHKLSYRYNTTIKNAIDLAMKENGMTKSEALDMIISEWLWYVAGK
jgi:antitoxin component of RelBE/YafQ-DinJ toxin-antitoxin module